MALVLIGIGAVALLRGGNDTATDPVTTDPQAPGSPSAPGTSPSAGGPPSGAPSSGGQPSAGSSAPAPPTTAKASEVVRAYLQALAAGQAETALALGESQPADKTFLTDAVLAASNKQAPITAVNVPEVTSEYTSRVSASYKMGNQAINEDFSVSKEGEGYRLRETYASLDLSYKRAKTLPMIINGVEVKTDEINLFPGTYAFTTGNPNISYGTENRVVIKGPQDYAQTSKIKPTLTEAGEAAYVKAAKSALDKCLSQKKLAPTGCPFRINDGGQDIDEDSIKWRVSGNDPFDNPRVRLDYDNPAVAISTQSAKLRVTADCNGRKNGCFKDLYKLLKPSVNLTKKPYKVVWEE